MPQLRFRGIDADTLRALSTDLVNAFVETVGCDPDSVTLELVQSQFIDAGAFSAGYPFVEVLWFDRGLAMQDSVASLITEQLQKGGIPHCDLFFTKLEKRDYYADGVHF